MGICYKRCVITYTGNWVVNCAVSKLRDEIRHAAELLDEVLNDTVGKDKTVVIVLLHKNRQ